MTFYRCFRIVCRILIPLLFSSLFVPCVQAQTAGALRILYFNDAHELDMVETELGRVGGVSRMKTLIDSVRMVDAGALVIFGGDLGGGTLGGRLYRGSVMVESLGRFQVDYANFGQHDFDYGVANTEELVKSSRHFQWFSSNVVREDGLMIEGSNAYIKCVRNGLRVGIVGLTDKVNTTGPLSGVKQLDIFGSVEHALRKVTDVDVLIAVTQMDMSLNEELLRRFPQIDVVLTEETSQHRSEVQFIGSRVIIAGCGNMGRLDEVVWRDGRIESVASHPVDTHVVPNPDLEAYVRLKGEEADRMLGEVIGTVSSRYYGGKCETGRLVAEAYRDRYGTQMALMNGGGLRSVFAKTDITTKDLYSVLPYGNLVAPYRLRGAVIRDMVQTAWRLNSDAAVSGADVEVHDDGLLDIVYQGHPLSPDEYYTIAIPSFIFMGGGDFEPITEPHLCAEGALMTDADIVQRYLKKLTSDLPK